ncbi:DUF2788 domain-containing protein [Methylotenera sp.]|uniref:DUF2788 domain-containing protein n=1 Tax=Methylotenera sp. TaxID=2051956 RepID=UPI002487CCFB|nr:DUF2788 domain-containing protein [Methylotenera sp.]MDI1361891.1 DUF2788 domain-containing protein [Methylotenera sp.]
MQGTIFGFTEAQISQFGMNYAVTGLMLLMMVIVGKLAWDSKAGKFGGIALFIGLTLGVAGFVIKLLIEHFLKI